MLRHFTLACASGKLSSKVYVYILPRIGSISNITNQKCDLWSEGFINSTEAPFSTERERIHTGLYANKIRQEEYIPYSRKLLWEKTFVNWLKKNFRGETFADCSLVPPKDVLPRFWWRKLLQTAIKPQNSLTFSPSKVFR